MDIKRKKFENLTLREKREILLWGVWSYFFYEESIEKIKEVEKKIMPIPPHLFDKSKK